jgi:alkylhydroperoxidase family enzyme
MPETMTPIPSVPVDWTDPGLAPLRERWLDNGFDADPPIYRKIVNAPEILQGWMTFSTALRFDSQVPRKTQELLIIAVATGLGSEYVIRAHVKRALMENASDDEIAVVRSAAPPSSDVDSELAALWHVGADVSRDRRLSDDTWSLLFASYSQRQALEIMIIASFYVMCCVASRSLRME